jgi:S1-C subfamily serine protease
MLRISALALSAFSLTTHPYCFSKSSEEVFQASLKSLFTIYFLDKSTKTLKNSCSGFFITEDGLGLTSAPFAQLFPGSQIKVKSAEGDEFDAHLTTYAEIPGIAFVQITGQNKGKLCLSKKTLTEGESVYIAGAHDRELYFDNVLVTDTKHNWVRFIEDDLVNTHVIRTTGLVPVECFGAPLIDEDGNVKAVVINVENGMAIGYGIENVKEVFGEENNGYFWRAWKRLRERINERLSSW